MSFGTRADTYCSALPACTSLSLGALGLGLAVWFQRLGALGFGIFGLGMVGGLGGSRVGVEEFGFRALSLGQGSTRLCFRTSLRCLEESISSKRSYADIIYVSSKTKYVGGGSCGQW